MDRTKVTFAQAERVSPLPQQLRPKQVSQQMRSLLWLVLHKSLVQAISPSSLVMRPPWPDIIRDYIVLIMHGFADEVSASEKVIIPAVKDIIKTGNYVGIFEFLQFLVRHRGCPSYLPKQIEAALLESGSAYRLIDKTFMPLASDEEAVTIVTAFSELEAGAYSGARAHLRKAGELLNPGHFADSIRESIHAVESVARTMDPTSTTLEPALRKLQKEHGVHPALRSGFSRLYGFTSDEQGIRHALLDGDESKVTEVDALYMFGACAAFVTYLVGKSREASSGTQEG